MKVEGTGLQTSISKGPFIHKLTGEIGTSQKIQNSPSTKGRREARTKYQCQWTGDYGNRTGYSNFESNIESIKYLLSLKVQCFKAGNISNYYSKWMELTSDPEVLHTVKGQLIEFTTTPYQHQAPAEKKFSAEESNIIQCEINKLLQKEVIQSTSYEPGQFISTIFLRPKPDGTHCMILNLKI